MKIDSKINELPLSKSKPETLISLFGNREIIPMWVADMEFEIAPPIQEALIHRVSNSGFGYEYRPASFFEAQKKWYAQKNQVELLRNQILFSPSITTSLAILIENLTSENAGIIIQPPVFMEFKVVINKTGRNIVKNALNLINGKYQMDFADLEAKARDKNNQMLILCNPHNPVGRVWSRQELARLVEICRENNVLLVSDEIHKDILLFGHTFISTLQFSKDYEKIVVCTSEAKTFNLCSMVDSMVITPHDNIRQSMEETLRKYNLGSTNALSRAALEAAYNYGQQWLTEILKIIETNIETIQNELTDSEIKLVKPEGTYQVWMDFNAIFDDSQDMFQIITEKSGIGMNAGHWFGREGALFMRMNIATSTEKVRYAINAVKNAAEKA